MRIAFFGGTFDPPHNGHTGLAEQVIASGHTDKVLFVPAFSPPHKFGLPVTPYSHRLAMLRLAVNATPGVEVSDIEARLGKSPSYTFEVMSALKLEFPEDRLQLMLGSDSLLQLHSWHMSEELVRRWEILTYPRSGEMAAVEDLCKFWDADIAGKLVKTVMKLPFFEISSTEIRKMIAKNEKVDKLIYRDVKVYIDNNGLYGSAEK
jgi:nicotinate-nucleotide adenylyltransferase